MRRIFRFPRFLVASLSLLVGASANSQVVQIRSALTDPGEQRLEISATLPAPRLASAAAGDVQLLPGLFRERRELTKAYLLRLKTRNLLQNHLLEAGARIDDPSEALHQGWEAPHYQLRGHFLGHWLAAAQRFAAIDGDPLMAARAKEVVSELKRCQELNGGQWVASIPEEYFAYLAQGRPIWSPQYTVHKTLMGLLEAYRLSGDEEALSTLENAAIWFDTWTRSMIDQGHGAAVYGGECAGMLELWADLFATTGNERHLKLAARYAMPDLFRELMEGRDALTNDHANASIPWIHGAARLYEVTGDERYRKIVESFWEQGVEQRGMFATTGNNAGEFWIPKRQFGRFLVDRAQEHCTVYNMIRVADYLYRWTGEARYADYIERALYNGILAQQNPRTGLVAYFLPLRPGAKKEWGTETRDFWCCHGTLAQAQAMYEGLIYHEAPDGVTVSQFIPSRGAFGAPGQQTRIVQTTDPSGGRANFTRTDGTTEFVVELAIASESSEPWTLRARRPEWALDGIKVEIDGKPVAARFSDSGFLEIARVWKEARVRIAFPKRVIKEALPGSADRFALLDGPIVLAALAEDEPSIVGPEALTPQYEHLYVEGRDWQTSHFLARAGEGTFKLMPLYEVMDERYTVYFAEPD